MIAARPPSGRLGLALAPSSVDLQPGRWRELVSAAVDAGFTSLWTLDNPLADQAEPLIWLATVASSFPHLDVGTAAIVAPAREPVLLAKQLATLDRLSGGGRLSVGLTIGRRPADYELTGTEYHRRGRALEDTVAVVRACWSGLPVDVVGDQRRWTHPAAIGVPIEDGTGSRPPPILLGGVAEVAVRRAVSLADGYLGSATGGPAAAVRAVERVAELLGGDGRPRSTFRTVTNVFVLLAPDRATAVEAAGAHFARRHGGRLFDPAEIVVGGPPAEVASDLGRLFDSGYDAVTVVPVVADLSQITALREVVQLLDAAVSADAP